MAKMEEDQGSIVGGDSKDRKMILTQVLVLSGIVFLVLSTTLYLLYETAFEQQKRRLLEMVTSQKLLIESIDKFNQELVMEGGSFSVTLSQIQRAYKRFEGLGDTGEILLGTIEKDGIRFLSKQRHDGEKAISLGLRLKNAEPMKKALSGMTGAITGLDYRRKMVLAAYTPIASLNLGLVAKVDLDEIRAPFIQAGLYGASFAVFLVLIGVYYSTRAGEELIAGSKANQQKAEEAQERLKKSNEVQTFLASIVENTDQAVIGKDLNGTILTWNQGAQNTYGYTAEEAIGKNITLIFPKVRIWESNVIIAKVKTGVKIYNQETQRLTKDGTLLDVSFTVSPIRNTGNQVIGASSIARDITEKKKVEQEIKKAKENAESANLAKSTFLANMSHEIRTPMNAILGYAQILGGDESLNVDQVNSIKTIERSGNHLLGLINDILDISKIEAGKTTLTLTNFNLSELANDLEAMFRLRCQEKDLGLDIEHPLEYPMKEFLVNGDERKLKQVLINLLGNAVKFTNLGTIKLRYSCKSLENHFLFEVIDTGRGIDPEAQGSIFEPFKQEKDGVRAGGTGLGLAIAKKQVESMGGQLKLESKPGEGSRFYFSIPLLPVNGLVNNLKGRYKDVVCVNEKSKVKALVVDDVKDNRDVLTWFLADINATVTEAKNGAEAIEKIESENPDIVFMDIHMPVMSGTKALQEIKRLFQDRNTKIVCITASAFDDQVRQYLEMGFDAFIAKPFKAEEILDALKTLLNVEYIYKEPGFEEEEHLEIVYEEIDFSVIKIPKELKEEIVSHAELFKVTELEKKIKELETLGDNGKTLVEYLTKSIKSYDMRTIIQTMKEVG
jgi:PAS domain S-box-containing protein